MPPHIERSEVCGATLIVLRDRSLPVTHFAVAMRTGAGHDPMGAAGATHLLLQLMVRGTERLSRDLFSGALEEQGSMLDAVVHSETALWRGVSLAENLKPTWDLLGEALTTPALAPRELERLQAEVCEALESSRDDDGTCADLFFRRLLYGAHPFARNPVGETTDIRGVDRALLGQLREQRVSCANLVLIFAGDIDTEAACQLTEPWLRRLPTGAVASALPMPRQERGVRFWVVDKPDRTQAQLRWGALACAGNVPQAFPLWMGCVAFGGTFTSPFTQEIRDRRGWSYGAHAGFDRRRRYPSPIVLTTAPAVADLAACVALERQLYADLARGHLEDEPFEQTRSYLLNRFPFQVATAADLVFPALQCELLNLPLAELFALPRELEAMRADAVRAALQHVLRPDAALGVAVATADGVVPALRAALPDVALEVVDYRD